MKPSTFVSPLHLHKFVPQNIYKSVYDVPTLPHLINFFANHKPCLITGAGISTESQIPDYRSPDIGSYSKGHTPVTYQKFIKSHKNRQRYYARNMIGYERFKVKTPNRVHFMISQLQNEPLNRFGGIITQNVDGLHQKAGSPNDSVIELHGSNHESICINCRRVTTREEYQQRLIEANREFFDETMEKLREVAVETNRSDGDVELSEVTTDFSRIVVPDCQVCGGLIKPNVIFFGENTEPAVKQQAEDLVKASDAVLVLGSSLHVFSSYRLILLAQKLDIPIAIVTLNGTRADDLEGVLKVEHNIGDVLEYVLETVPFESL